MKSIFYLLTMIILFTCSCASTQKEVRKDGNNTLYTVKVVNSSPTRASLRYASDNQGYTFRFVDSKNEIKFLMDGELTIQYTIKDGDDSRIIKIKQDTFIEVKQNDIIVDDLPITEKIKSGKNK